MVAPYGVRFLDFWIVGSMDDWIAGFLDHSGIGMPDFPILQQSINPEIQ